MPLLGLFLLGRPTEAERTPLPGVPRHAPDLSGRWLLIEVASTRSQVVALGELRSELQAGLLLDLQHRDGRLRGEGEVCRFRLESPTAFVKVEFPDAFRAALAPPMLDARVEYRDDALYFEQPRMTAVLGAALQRPLGEPLPARADDPRVVDADGDGKPGVTIRVTGLVDGEMYLVQRSWSAMAGRATSSLRIEGALLHDKEEVVLGATHAVLAAFPPTRPDPARSYFILERLPQTATCAEAVLRMESLLDD